MPRFSAEERAENTAFAVEEHAKGRSYSEIARELSVDRKTVKGWIDAEYARRSEHRTVSDAREQSIARYEALLRETWQRIGKTGTASLNSAGLINAARGLQERIDKLTGAEAPAKVQHLDQDEYEVVWHDIDPSEITED